MNIAIQTKEIVFGIRKNSESELETIYKEESDRYKVAPGSEKEYLVLKAIDTARSEIESAISRFIVVDYGYGDLEYCEPLNTDTEYVIPDWIVFNLKDSPRRLFTKQNAIKTHCANALIEGGLSKFYSSVGAAELASAHETRFTEICKKLSDMLYHKNEPIL